jgi:hypothetical protein
MRSLDVSRVGPLSAWSGSRESRLSERRIFHIFKELSLPSSYGAAWDAPRSPLRISTSYLPPRRPLRRYVLYWPDSDSYFFRQVLASVYSFAKLLLRSSSKCWASGHLPSVVSHPLRACISTRSRWRAPIRGSPITWRNARAFCSASSAASQMYKADFRYCRHRLERAAQAFSPSQARRFT